MYTKNEKKKVLKSMKDDLKSMVMQQIDDIAQTKAEKNLERKNTFGLHPDLNSFTQVH